MRKWRDSDNYMGYDLSNYYVFIARGRDSDFMENSNFDCVLRDLKEKFADKENDPEEGEKIEKGWFIASFGHWACGWYEQVMIHESEKEIIEFCDGIQKVLENYSLYDEDDYIERENNYREENFVMIACSDGEDIIDKVNYEMIKKELKQRFSDDEIDEDRALDLDGWFDDGYALFCHKDMKEFIEEAEQRLSENNGLYNSDCSERIGELLTIDLFSYSTYDNKFVY